MPEELIIDKMELGYSGIVDLKEFYKVIFDFWEDKGFDIIETKHKEKVSKDGKTREINSEFFISREETSYLKYIYELSVEMNGVKLVESDGKTVNEVSEMSIKINGKLDYDYSAYFKKDKPFTSFLRVLYESYINKSEIEYHRERVAKYAIDFYKELRKFLKIY